MAAPAHNLHEFPSCDRYMKRFEAQALLTKLALAESMRIRAMVTRIQNFWRLSKRRRVLQCRRRRRRQRLRERAKNKVPDLCDDYLSDDFYNPPRAPIEGGAHLPLGAPFLRGRRTRGMKLTWHVSGIVIGRCFLFSFPHPYGCCFLGFSLKGFIHNSVLHHGNIFRQQRFEGVDGNSSFLGKLLQIRDIFFELRGQAFVIFCSIVFVKYSSGVL